MNELTKEKFAILKTLAKIRRIIPNSDNVVIKGKKETPFASQFILFKKQNGLPRLLHLPKTVILSCCLLSPTFKTSKSILVYCTIYKHRNIASKIEEHVEKLARKINALCVVKIEGT